MEARSSKMSVVLLSDSAISHPLTAVDLNTTGRLHEWQADGISHYEFLITFANHNAVAQG
jgi:hypothetical protein